MDAAGSSGRKVTHEGKDYDYVFDVDIEEGKPPLKLPYNSNQNPYEVAQKFIANNELPVTYLDQVANFILSNTQGASLGSGPQEQTGQGSDPWGTGNRYRPGEAGAPEPQAETRPRALPQTQYLSITTANLPAIRKKINELNESASSESRLSNDETTAIDNLVKQLQSSPRDPKPQSDQMSAVVKVATQWPPANRLPGLDLLRLAAIAPSFAQSTSSGEGTIVDLLSRAGIFAADTDKPNNTMLATRALANIFTTEGGRLIADGCFEQILQSVEPFISSGNKNLSAAIATLHINFSVLLTSSAPSGESKTREQRAASIANQIIPVLSKTEDNETGYRSLVALGTLMSLGENFRREIQQAKNLGQVLGTVEKGSLGKEARVKNVVEEIKVYLQ